MFKKRIRKDAGEITLYDLNEYPSWEFCLDEEGQEGQTECTIRPFKSARKKLSPDDNCLVASDFVTKSGARFIGWFNLGQGDFNSVWDLSPEIFLARDAMTLTGEERLLITCPGSIRVSLYLPSVQYASDNELEPHLTLVHQLLGANADAIFPLMVIPRQPIIGWPTQFPINRFERPPNDNDHPSSRWPVDTPQCPQCGKPLRTALGSVP